MANRKIIKSGVRPFIRQEGVVAPFTTIQNRALVGEPLKAVFGTERIHMNSLNKLLKESGPNGEVVYEPDNGDTRVRLVGNWISEFGNRGSVITSKNTNDFAEITFYGTGLSLICFMDVSANPDWRISVDGGAEGANVYVVTSPIIGFRNYKSNVILNVSQSLTLGWHTIRVRNNENVSSFGLAIFGFEILNESSDITVLKGSAFSNGYEYSIDTDTIIPFATGFDNIIDANIGVKGGRALIYIDPVDVAIKKRFTKVDSTALFLGASDHTNEAPYRIINWREFGRNRADDFSTLASGASDRTFTLDDGATTLVGKDVIENAPIPNTVRMNSAVGFLTLTFEGTGLDVVLQPDLSGFDTHTVFVDGISVGVISAVNGVKQQITLCSGLPEGSHTVQITRDGFITGSISFTEYILYHPSKPVLPEGAIELAEYNLLADFIANTVANSHTIATGVLRKASEREFSYAGTWVLGVDPAVVHGIQLAGDSAGATASKEFIGVGFDFRYRTLGSHTTDSSIFIDDVLLSESNFTINGTGTGPAVTVAQYGNGSFTTSTGVLNQNGVLTNGSGLTVNGLSYGKHSFKWVNNVAVRGAVETLDIITPIHAPHTTFGSRSINDLRNFDNGKSVNKVIKNTESSFYVDSTLSIVENSKNIAQLLRTAAGRVTFYFEEVYTNGNYIFSGGGQFSRMIGTNISERRKHSSALANYNDAGSISDGLITMTIDGKLEKDELED